MNGRRLAVAGMGRSGMAIAGAAARRGACVTVYDQMLADTPERIALVEELQGLGVEVATGWHGRLAGTDFDVLVASPGFRREHPAIRDALQAGRRVISEVEFAYSIARAPIIAITGTNGKSTTTVLTWLLARAAGLEAVLCGNISGSGYPELTLTEAADATTEGGLLVAEVSSYQLEWVEAFRPRAAAVTNVSPDHMDRHPSFEDYVATKLRIFARMGEGDVAVINESEPTLPIETVLAALPEGVGLRTFAADPGRYRAHDGAFSSPTTFLDGDHVVLSGNRVPLEALGLRGTHSVVNAMMAWELIRAVRATSDADEAMIQALASFRGLSNRLEYLGARSGVQVFNNSMCTNPAAVVASARALPMRQHLLMGGNVKNLDFGPVRRMLEATGHRAYLFGGEADQLAAQLGDIAPAYVTLEEAFAAAVASADIGEAIVLSPGCLSAAPFTGFRHRGEAFRQIAKEWLEQ